MRYLLIILCVATSMCAFGQEDFIRNYPQPPMHESATTQTIPAIKGQRIVDAVTGRILEEPRHIFITSDQLINFSDDGKTSGDIKAHDGVFSNVLPPNKTDFIGEASHHMLLFNLKILRTIDEMSPLTFFGGVSAIDKEYKSLLEEKNKRLEEWTIRFLNPYRIHKDEMDSPFYRLYVPIPPNPPITKAPPGFTTISDN